MNVSVEEVLSAHEDCIKAYKLAKDEPTRARIMGSLIILEWIIFRHNKNSEKEVRS